VEGVGKWESGERKMCFLLKGRGKVMCGEYQYNIKSGNVFGQVEMLGGGKIDRVDF
jgi:hypothetical protein